MISSALGSLVAGFASLSWGNGLMILVGLVLIFLAIKKGFEPLLLIPIGFGAVLVNIPLSGIMEQGGLLRYLYEGGIITEIFPLLIFLGIGAMTDFGPLLENPRILLLGAAGQFGIFITLILALLLGFTRLESATIGIIGAMDGPTAIYVSTKFAPHLLGAVVIAAYSYISLAPIIMPPLMKLLTTKRERGIIMRSGGRPVSPTVKMVFPLVVTLITGLIAPMGLPLMGMLMLGNFLRESGAVERLTNASQNEIANVVTLFLGIAVGATMAGEVFIRWQTIVIFALGFVAICLDTITGLLFGKLMRVLTHDKVNPLIGAAGISAFPMAARVVQIEGQKANPESYLLMHAMGANCGGQIGSVMAAAVMLSVLKGLGVT